jgi:hypothetical protein
VIAMAVAVIDVDYLSGYLGISQQTLSTVIDTPTAELVQAVLEALTAKAREHEELTADKLRVDIELENAVRSSETRLEGLRSQVEKAQKTVEELRIKLKEEGKSDSGNHTNSSTNYYVSQKIHDLLSRANSKPSKLHRPRQHLSWKTSEREFPPSKLPTARLLPYSNRRLPRMTILRRTYKGSIKKDWSWVSKSLHLNNPFKMPTLQLLALNSGSNHSSRKSN